MADTLKAFVDEDPAAPRLVFRADTIKRLNELLEWPIDSEASLLERIGRLKRVAVPKLGFSIDLSESQLLALKSQADFWNRDGKATGEELAKFCKQQLEAGLAKVLGIKA
jgi:hypothetical protein